MSCHRSSAWAAVVATVAWSAVVGTVSAFAASRQAVSDATLEDWDFAPAQHRAALMQIARGQVSTLPAERVLALGDALLRTGEPGVAGRLFRNVLARDVGPVPHAWARYGLGWVLLADGRFAAAVEQYQAIVAGGSNWSTASILLAMLGAGSGARMEDTVARAVAAEERGEIAIAPDATEALADLLQGGGDPAHEHRPVAPAAHVVREPADAAVEVLDRVRRAQRAVERAGHPEALERERLVEAFAQGRGRAGVRALEPGRELLEAALGKGGVDVVVLEPLGMVVVAMPGMVVVVVGAATALIAASASIRPWPARLSKPGASMSRAVDVRMFCTWAGERVGLLLRRSAATAAEWGAAADVPKNGLYGPPLGSLSRRRRTQPSPALAGRSSREKRPGQAPACSKTRRRPTQGRAHRWPPR
jgi:hypothetical protein